MDNRRENFVLNHLLLTTGDSTIPETSCICNRVPSTMRVRITRSPTINTAPNYCHCIVYIEILLLVMQHISMKNKRFFIIQNKEFSSSVKILFTGNKYLLMCVHTWQSASLACLGCAHKNICIIKTKFLLAKNMKPNILEILQETKKKIAGKYFSSLNLLMPPQFLCLLRCQVLFYRNTV